MACDMTGTYITRNAGRSWRMFNLRGRIYFFVFDPTDPQVIYAKATGLWRSSDGGRAGTWSIPIPRPSSESKWGMIMQARPLCLAVNLRAR